MSDITISKDQAELVRSFVELAVDDVVNGGQSLDEARDIAGNHVEIEKKIEAVFWQLMDSQDLIKHEKPEMFGVCKILFDHYLEEILHGEG